MDTPMMAETVTITGHDGDEIEAYFARPTSPGPHPGVVVIHHMPGYDRSTKEIVRTFAVVRLRRALPEPPPPLRARRQGHRRGRGRGDRGGRRARRPVHRRRAAARPTSSARSRLERPGRRDRLLLGRPPGLRGRVQPRHRRRRRLLRRSRRRHARRPHARAADLADRPHARPAVPAARPVRRRGHQPVARSRPRRSKRRCARTARPTSSTPSRTRATRSSPSTVRTTASTRRKEGWKLIWDFFGRYLGHRPG